MANFRTSKLGRIFVLQGNSPTSSCISNTTARWAAIAACICGAARPGEWESYDVTLVGRTVTAVRDGVLIINAKQIPGITGGALDSHEGEPGPIYLQGEHTGGLRYRNITIAVPQ